LIDLNLSHCAKITDTSVSRLTEICPELRSLDLSFCDHVIEKNVIPGRAERMRLQISKLKDEVQLNIQNQLDINKQISHFRRFMEDPTISEKSYANFLLYCASE
jgi:hypothetical protein